MRRLRRALLCVLIFFIVICPKASAVETASGGPGDGIEGFASSLMKQLASIYYDYRDNKFIKVAVFDFTDARGNISWGSRHISDRMKVAFARAVQFELVQSEEDHRDIRVTSEMFESDPRLRNLITEKYKADAYIFGRVVSSDKSRLVCSIDAWGVSRPFDYYEKVSPLLLDESDLEWSVDLNDSGLLLMNQILLNADSSRLQGRMAMNMGEVLFLTQPISDDLNRWWLARDGMIVSRKEQRSTIEMKGDYSYGRVMESRVKGQDDFQGLNYAVKNFNLMVRESGSAALNLECYTIPKSSEYYLMPESNGRKYRFKYLWSLQGKGKRLSPEESGKSWNFYLAEDDWSIKMPVGVHSAVASFRPVAQRLYGAIMTQPEYLNEFRFEVRPGLNVFVVNYVFHRDNPAIFIKRLVLSDTDDPLKRKTIISMQETSAGY